MDDVQERKGEIHEDPLATFWLDQDGILHLTTKPIQLSRDNSHALIQKIKKLTGGRKVYVISNLTPIKEITEEGRIYYKKEFPSIFKAIAFVSASELGRMVGTVLFLIMDPLIPTQIFDNEAEAREWLKELQESGETILPDSAHHKKINGKLVLVDDEPTEKKLMEMALKDGHWLVPIEYFSDAASALKYLRETEDEIFLIISDIKMPGMDGFTFKKTIDTDEQLKRKSIPFIFASNSTSKDDITAAYDNKVQGYFQKPLDTEMATQLFDKIFNYWLVSRHPHKEHY